MISYMFVCMHCQMKKLSPVARLVVTSATLRTLQHVHLKKMMQKRPSNNEAVLWSSRKWFVCFATHLKWEYWLLGVATFTNKGSCLEEDVKHGTNNEFLLLNIVQNCLSKKRSTSEMVPGKAHSFSHEPGLEIWSVWRKGATLKGF